MVQTIRAENCCYLSAPEHLRTFIGWFVYIYTAKGRLDLTSESLTFTSKKTSFGIPLGSIVDLRCGHYPRKAKPFRLDYIAVTYRQDGSEETILLTPARSGWAPVWRTNKLVASWMSTLDETIHSHP